MRLSSDTANRLVNVSRKRYRNSRWVVPNANADLGNLQDGYTE